MLRCEQPGWIQIGLMCSAGRRSMWVRFTPGPNGRDATVVELCAGREGDDDYLRVEAGQPLFQELVDIMSTALFAAET